MNGPSEKLQAVEDQVNPIFHAALDKFYTEDRDEYFSGFSNEEQVTALVAMCTVIPYDGIHGWLERNSGMLFEETCEALEEIGALKYKSVFDRFGSFLDSIGQPRNADFEREVIYKYLESDIGPLEEEFCELLEDEDRSLYVIFLNWHNSLENKPFEKTVK